VKGCLRDLDIWIAVVLCICPSFQKGLSVFNMLEVTFIAAASPSNSLKGALIHCYELNEYKESRD
jgi:hypothetical protein